MDITASFLLSDCVRNVTLDLDMWTNATAALKPARYRAVIAIVVGSIGAGR